MSFFLFLMATFAWQDNPSKGTLTLTDSGKTVFVYNYAAQLKPGVPADRRRSSYIHPLYSPGGVLLTDDFPKDHYHHRGLFWAWPVVQIDKAKHDSWMIKGIEQRFERWVEKRVTPQAAIVVIENGWYVNNTRVARETVRLEVHPVQSNERPMDVTLTFEPLATPIEIAGSPDNKKGYGGLSARFAPRTETTIRADSSPVPKDEDHGAHKWAELEALFDGRRAGLRMDASPSNPGFPNEWCLRLYGFLGANFPGVEPYRLEPAKPLTLHYRVTVFDKP